MSLAVVTLGSFDYPVLLIEFAIALSLFVLALALSRQKPTNLDQKIPSVFRRHPWWLAGGFGLLHGMGFAGALAEIGLPQDNVPLALLFFNIGIEIGQITFVLLAIGLWWVIERAISLKQETINPSQLMPLPVYGLGGLSAMWCIERGLDLLG